MTTHTPLRQRGQSAVEFLVIFPVLIFLVFGIIQWALIYQARNTLNHAVFLAARAGALNYGEKGKMKSALAAGLTPLFASEASMTGYVMAKGKALVETNIGMAKLEVLNPTREAFQDFGRNRLDSTGGKEIPNDTLVYRNPNAGSSSKMSVQDANILHLRVTYCYRLIVPVVGRMIHAVSNASSWSGALDATGMQKPFGDIDTPMISSCPLSSVGGDPRIPIRSEAIVRMQTPFRDNNL